MDGLLQSMLALTKLDAQRPELHMELLDFSSLISQAAESFDVLANANQVSLSLQVAPGAFVTGDADSLRQLVSILMENAIKYAGPGGKVVVHLDKQGKSLCFWVENTCTEPVSYTHLDVYKRQALGFLNNKGTDLFNARVITVNGKITAQQTAVLAQAAEKFGSGEVEFTTRLTVEIRGVHFDDIPAFQEFIAPAGLITGGTGSLVRPVVSCKGTTCQYGLYDTFALSEKIHQQFYLGYHSVKLPHKFKIACGGCPNNCVKPTPVSYTHLDVYKRQG